MTIQQELIDWARRDAESGIRKALPRGAYTSEEIAALERERVFGRGWINVGHASQLAEPGDYVTFEVVDHPVIAVRGRDDELRAFSNVCPHRSAIIARDCGNRTVFQFPLSPPGPTT